MKRVVTPELLDGDSGTPAEIASALSDLRRINYWFGGVKTTQSMVQCVAGRTGARSFALLEVAGGSGDVPRGVGQRLQRHGIRIEASMLDRAASHLKHRTNGIRAVGGDALALPFADNSFDLVSCCLFAHHLAPDELVRFVNEGLRVCRVAVLINDLVRHPLHWALVYAGWPLYRSRLTQHDAPASVRAAYTPQEMREILKETSAREVVMGRHYLFRMGVVVWK
ncbi:MAG TPA: methyltransferase domain-containing protein [Terriglobales bacterium]|nr:methyltransferase domain-containing protein [Terriglobales bacterium]